MEYRENLLWILDSPRRGMKQESEYQFNIDFVHSLGLKCDSVGWSKLDLTDPQSDEILTKIDDFCRRTGWKARGWYERVIDKPIGQWYALKVKTFRDCSFLEVPTELCAGDGFQRMLSIKAYQEPDSGPKFSADSVYVAERFRNFCIRHRMPGVDFCWVKDTGRYEAEQYFQLFVDSNIEKTACGRGLSFGRTSRALDQRIRERLESLGGYLPRLAEIFYDLRIQIPECYLASDLPADGIAVAHYPMRNDHIGRRTILLHKDLAQRMLQEKALSPKDLAPVYVADELPAGYILEENQPMKRPSQAYISYMNQAYEKWKAMPRPVRQVSEKEALKILRAAKKERKSDFQKAIPKAKATALESTPYAPLASYYLIANGGCLSDEYEFLSWERAEAETKAFFAQLQKEELLQDKPEGVVFAQCADGDKILLCGDGSLLRFSHEAPEAVDSWPTAAQFFFDAINE